MSKDGDSQLLGSLSQCLTALCEDSSSPCSVRPCLAAACNRWLLSYYLCPESDCLLYDPPFRWRKTAMRCILSFLFSRLNKPRSFSLSSCIIYCKRLSTLGGPPLNRLQFVHISCAGHRSLNAASGVISSIIWWLVCLALVAARVHC